MSEEYLSTKEAAKRLKVSESTIKNMIRDGYIRNPVKKNPFLRSQWMIPVSEIERIEKERKNGTK